MDNYIRFAFTLVILKMPVLTIVTSKVFFCCCYCLQLIRIMFDICLKVVKIEWENKEMRETCFMFLFNKMKNSYLTWLLPNFDKHRTIYEPLLGKLWRETSFMFNKMKNSYLTWLLPNFDKHRTIYEPLLGKLWRETCFCSTRWKTLTSHGYCPTLTNIGPSMSLCLISYGEKPVSVQQDEKLLPHMVTAQLWQT